MTELIVAELLFLNFDQPEKPVYFYINSTGSQVCQDSLFSCAARCVRLGTWEHPSQRGFLETCVRGAPALFSAPPQTQEGQSVGFETEAYAIMDTLRYIRPDVHTVCCGKAFGNAAMLLASGKKGCRYALPHASIMTCPPRLNRKVDTATNLMITANELDANTETYVDYLTEFTGRTREDVTKLIARTTYFTPEDAIEYGLIDKVVNPKSVRAEGVGTGDARREQSAR